LGNQVVFVIDSQEIDSIKNQLIEKYRPLRIILFGSQAKETAGRKSDIDLCIVKETENKRALAVEMSLNIESTRPMDIIVYTPDEWDSSRQDSTSFASMVWKRGVEIYGG